MKVKRDSPENLPEVWLKAAIAGSLWASVEIVAGAFLHNLRVPMAGAMLAAAGVALLSGIHQLWPVKGLLWRAGLICALMKSVSPSAVIFGPMVGIFTESLLMEAALRLLGRNLPAYLAGGALAVSWTFLQRLANVLIQFGANVVDLYVNIVEFAARNLSLGRLGPIELLAAILATHAALGITSAALAVTAARRVRTHIAAPSREPEKLETRWEGFQIDKNTVFSLHLLAFNLAALVAGLWLLNRGHILAACAYVAAFSVGVVWRYRNSLRRLARPRLWIELAVITIASGFLLGNFQAGTFRWTAGGVLTGAAMALRAWLVTSAFAAIGVELRNPKILEWFAKQRLRTLSDALSVAFQALPFFIASLPAETRLVREPAAVFSGMLLRAESWLASYRFAGGAASRVLLLTGGSGDGKTTLIRQVAASLRERGVVVGGVLAPGFWKDGNRSGFDVVDLFDGRKAPLCRRSEDNEAGQAGTPFRFLPEGLRLGREALSAARLHSRNVALVVVDEIGPLELAGEGWAPALDSLVEQWRGPMIWVVRRDLVQKVKQRWLQSEPEVLDVRQAGPADIVQRLQTPAVERV